MTGLLHFTGPSFHWTALLVTSKQSLLLEKYFLPYTDLILDTHTGTLERSTPLSREPGKIFHVCSIQAGSRREAENKLATIKADTGSSYRYVPTAVPHFTGLLYW
jgi:hypothetical protein